MNKPDADALDELFNYFNTGEEPESWKEPYEDPKHGKVVETKMAAYGDWTIYKDGYEEFNYIGD
jgi:hypothetical protein